MYVITDTKYADAPHVRKQFGEIIRALEHLGNAPEWVSSGFDAIYRRLNNLLQAQGIVPYESVGEIFDPERHEAVGLTEDQDVEPGIVVAELNRGYCWGDEVLRPARVRVSQ